MRARPPAAAGVHATRHDRGGSVSARRARDDARHARRGGEVGGLSSSDGASAGYRGQIGVRSSWAHAVARDRVPRRRHARDRDERAGLGLQRRARARDGSRPADRRAAATVRAHRRRAGSRLRRDPAGRDVRRRRRRGHEVLRGARPAPVLAAAHRPRDRPAQSRGAVPRPRRPHGARARNGVHGRARPVRLRSRRLPPLRHGRRDRGRDGEADRLPDATSTA